MKIKKLKAHQTVSLDLQSKPSRFVIETAKTDPKLPALFAFCGSRGSGKTYACVAMCSHFEKMGYITRTFLICPTRASNSIYSNLETLDEERDVCDQESRCQLALQNIIKEVKRDWHAYDFEKKYAQLYKKWKKNPYIINIVEEKLLNDQGHREPEHLPRPAHMLIVDDCQGTGMYSDAKRDLMKHVTIKHRHIPLSICFLVQSWVGLPRTIRLNATHFIIYRTGDIKQLKQIYEHFGTYVTWDKFEEMYKYATSKPHGFLYIDTDPKKDYMRYRSGFDEFLLNKNT